MVVGVFRSFFVMMMAQEVVMAQEEMVLEKLHPIMNNLV